jgi:hypothetical protein
VQRPTEVQIVRLYEPQPGDMNGMVRLRADIDAALRDRRQVFVVRHADNDVRRMALRDDPDDRPGIQYFDNEGLASLAEMAAHPLFDAVRFRNKLSGNIFGPLPEAAKGRRRIDDDDAADDDDEGAEA